MTKDFINKIDRSWDSFLSDSKHFNKMLIFVNKEDNICPLKSNVFRFFELDLNKLKCVILGMDPYPSTYIENGKKMPVATGRSFEVANVLNFTDKYKQSSLSNIFKALCYLKYGKKYDMEKLRDITANYDFKYINIHDWFDAMEFKGVMFLNSTLTTKMGESGAHTTIWEDFMTELISFMVKRREDLKWFIWGKNALNRVEGLVDKKDIIYSCHPASRMNNDFVDSCCFKKMDEIDWV